VAAAVGHDCAHDAEHAAYKNIHDAPRGRRAASMASVPRGCFWRSSPEHLIIILIVVRGGPDEVRNELQLDSELAVVPSMSMNTLSTLCDHYHAILHTC
jgi:hypothetical protein